MIPFLEALSLFELGSSLNLESRCCSLLEIFDGCQLNLWAEELLFKSGFRGQTTLLEAQALKSCGSLKDWTVFVPPQA